MTQVQALSDRLSRELPELLQLLIDHHGGGPVGLETLAAALGDDPVTLETVVEPFLLQQGLLMRTPRGRMVTDAARSHLAEAA